jgi:hypothetical protein
LGAAGNRVGFTISDVLPGGLRVLENTLRLIAMDSAQNGPAVDEIASLVVERLLVSGKLPDLANANLMTIEEQTIEQVDQVTRSVMSELIARQPPHATAPTCCPKCGGAMKEKKPQHRSLESRRGKVNFITEVFHCEACRLDFFPSDENAAV